MVCFAPPPYLPVYLSSNVGLQGLLAAALFAPLHNPPPHWVRQPQPCCESSPPRLPVSVFAPPTGVGECFFFISLVVGLPCSSIFCQFWLFFVFKLLLSFFWLCEEAQCVYLHLHLGRTWVFFFFMCPMSLMMKLCRCQTKEPGTWPGGLAEALPHGHGEIKPQTTD